MSTKFIIGSAAIAGGAYYLYQQRLEQTQAPAKHSIGLPTFGSSKSSVGEGTGERTGRKLDEAALSARERLDQLGHDAGKKIDGTLASVEEQRSKLNGWASDKLASAQESLDTHADHAAAKAEALAKQAHRDDPGRLRQFGHEVKETVVDAKESVAGGLHNAKESIVGSKNKAEQKVGEAKDKASSGWFTLTESKDEELARKTKKSLEGWGETASQSATEYYEAVTDQTPRSRSWFSWGSRASDTQDSAQKAYDDAQKSYEDAKKRFKDTKDSWFSFKEDVNKKRLHAEAEKQLDYAQKQLESASSKLDEWKRRAQNYDRIGGAKQYKGFYDWLRGGVPYQQERVTGVSRDAVRGWGSVADEAAQDHHDANKYARKNVQGQYNDGYKTAKDWSNWFTKKYDQSAEGAQQYYTDAEQALKDAKKDLDKQSSHWWSWGKQTSKELELEAKHNVEAAEKRLSEATNNLSKWGIDAADKFWRGAEDAVHHTKKGLNQVNQSTQSGLSEAQSWIRDQQK